jgi:tRNA isopentenyl-2-thiomethyl-A-37 hydroxylase MiaE
MSVIKKDSAILPIQELSNRIEELGALYESSRAGSINPAHMNAVKSLVNDVRKLAMHMNENEGATNSQEIYKEIVARVELAFYTQVAEWMGKRKLGLFQQDRSPQNFAKMLNDNVYKHHYKRMLATTVDDIYQTDQLAEKDSTREAWAPIVSGIAKIYSFKPLTPAPTFKPTIKTR